jgi:hypothetical protein
MAMPKGNSSNLDQPLPYPEDPSLTCMTVNVEEPACPPPGMTTLRQWGSMVLPEGKHKNKSFMDVVACAGFRKMV